MWISTFFRHYNKELKHMLVSNHPHNQHQQVLQKTRRFTRSLCSFECHSAALCCQSVKHTTEEECPHLTIGPFIF